MFKEEKVHNFFESQQAIILMSTYLQDILKNVEKLDENLLKKEFLKLLQVKLVILTVYLMLHIFYNF